MSRILSLIKPQLSRASTSSFIQFIKSRMCQFFYPNFRVTINLIESGRRFNITGINNGPYWEGFSPIVITDRILLLIGL